jgi:photosystem II stability/assembly factor-like uncharacterized protein
MQPDFCDNSPMRLLLLLLISAPAIAQSGLTIQRSNTSESLRGVSAVSRQIAWASGTDGTYLRTTDAGQTWTPAQVPEASQLDFRAVVAFSADEAFLMSAGPGDQSRIYHTADAGGHWQLQFVNNNAKGFFDSMLFWDRTHGIILGDPIPDESGQLKFELLITEDGEHWRPVPPSQLPAAREGEGAFAASNTCLAILEPRNRMVSSGAGLGTDGKGTTSSRALRPSEAKRDSALESSDPNIWFATGGKTARVFHSPDRGQTWQVFDTPILHGPDSAGIFSIAFRDPLHGVIAGGDYQHPSDDGPNLAFTSGGGKTWTLSPIHPQAYFSAVAYDLQVNGIASREQASALGKKKTKMPVARHRLFLIGHDFIVDLRSLSDSRRIRANNPAIKFNAVSPYPEGGALVVGPQGVIASVP